MKVYRSEAKTTIIEPVDADIVTEQIEHTAKYGAAEILRRLDVKRE